MRPPALARTHAKRLEVPLLLVGASVALAMGLSVPLILVEKAFVLENEYSVWTGITELAEDEQESRRVVDFL